MAEGIAVGRTDLPSHRCRIRSWAAGNQDWKSGTMAAYDLVCVSDKLPRLFSLQTGSLACICRHCAGPVIYAHIAVQLAYGSELRACSEVCYLITDLSGCARGLGVLERPTSTFTAADRQSRLACGRNDGGAVTRPHSLSQVQLGSLPITFRGVEFKHVTLFPIKPGHYGRGGAPGTEGTVRDRENAECRPRSAGLAQSQVKSFAES